jgi:Tol biopolymer transport system component
MDADGTDQTNLTNSPYDDWEPCWAPTGSRLVFVSNRDGGPDLYIMNGDGTGVQRQTDNAAKDWEPAWSPDGTKIIFSSDRDGDFEIYSIAAPEEEDEEEAAAEQVTYPTATQLTTNTDEDTHPGWSSNSSTVTYLTSKDGGSLYLMDADGTDARSGAATDWIRSASSWANTATQIAYAKEQGVNWPRLWLLTNTTNTPIAALQPTSAQADGYPAWSKDDKTLLFTRWKRTESPF